MRFSTVAAFALTTWSTMQSAAPAPGISPAAHPHVVLVELFTSEGCSDCPPADQLLRQIDGKKYGQNTLIVGLSEHVTYWDHIGWKDPYSADTMTERQYAYGQRFALDSVYTPQMVVNGESQMVGSNSTKVQQGLDSTHQNADTSVQLGAVQLDGDTVQAAVTVSGMTPKQGADLFVAIAEDETTYKIPSGENRGRTLEHTSVARTLVKVASVKAAGESAVRVKLPVMDAGSRRHLVVWLQEQRLRRVLGADSREF